MADPPRDPDTGEDAGVAADHRSPPGMPRWVKTSGIIVAILVVLVVIVLLISGGHRPRPHASSAGLGGQAPRSGVTAASTLSGGGPWDPPPSGASAR